MLWHTLCTQTYLKSVRSKLACSAIKLVPLNKDPHVLEVPDGVKVPGSYDLVGQKKGFNRSGRPSS